MVAGPLSDSRGRIRPLLTGLAGFSLAETLCAASAWIGLGQFGLAALLAPLVGIGRTHDARPMGVVMLVCGCWRSSST